MASQCRGKGGGRTAVLTVLTLSRATRVQGSALISLDLNFFISKLKGWLALYLL